jgi:hypothetical protein
LTIDRLPSEEMQFLKKAFLPLLSMMAGHPRESQAEVPLIPYRMIISKRFISNPFVKKKRVHKFFI